MILIEYSKIDKQLPNKPIKSINTIPFVFIVNQMTYFYIYYKPDKNICIIDENCYKYLDKVLISLFTQFNDDTLLVVHISMNSYDYIVKRDSFVKSGFNSPYVSNIAILEGKINDSVFLSKQNIPNGASFPDITFKKIDYAVSQFKNSMNTCFLYAKLNKKTVDFLKKSCTIGYTINKNGKQSQKELTGELFICDIVYARNKHICLIDVDRKSIKAGKEEDVNVAATRYNFHSHPRDAYIKHSVSYAWPSVTDYLGYLHLGKNTIFHCVCALEGIYIISFNLNWISQLENVDKKFINKNYDIDILSKKNKKLTPEKYIQKINNILYKGYPIFDVRFFVWEKANTVFKIYYAKNDNSCILSEDIVKKYKKIYSKNK